MITFGVGSGTDDTMREFVTEERGAVTAYTDGSREASYSWASDWSGGAMGDPLLSVEAGERFKLVVGPGQDLVATRSSLNCLDVYLSKGTPVWAHQPLPGADVRDLLLFGDLFSELSGVWFTEAAVSASTTALGDQRFNARDGLLLSAAIVAVPSIYGGSSAINGFAVTSGTIVTRLRSAVVATVSVLDNLDVGTLAYELRLATDVTAVTDTSALGAQLKRTADACGKLLDQQFPNAPVEARRSALVQMSGWLFDRDFGPGSVNDALTASGWGRALQPYRVIGSATV